MKGLSKKLEKDRISELPDPLICHILSHLPTKEAVSTSVLSTRWKTLWLWVTRLEFDFTKRIQDLISFANFVERVFDPSRVSCIQKLKLTIDDHETSYPTSLIDVAVKRKIQHLDVLYRRSMYFYMIPISLYSCDTLVSLKLSQVEWVSAEFVSLPCLKTMYLGCNMFYNEATFERLVSCCPVLEKLKIRVTQNDRNVYRVHSPSLKMLTFMRASCFQVDNASEVIIDAPLLCSLRIIDSASKFNIVNNLESLVKLDISWGRSRISSLLSKISRVRDMAISSATIKDIHQYSKLEPLPQFGYLSRLSVTFFTPNLTLLPTFLESCPNMKSLVLIGRNQELSAEEMKKICSSFVPKCLLSSLEYVDIKT